MELLGGVGFTLCNVQLPVSPQMYPWMIGNRKHLILHIYCMNCLFLFVWASLQQHISNWTLHDFIRGPNRSFGAKTERTSVLLIYFIIESSHVPLLYFIKNLIWHSVALNLRTLIRPSKSPRNQCLHFNTHYYHSQTRPFTRGGQVQGTVSHQRSFKDRRLPRLGLVQSHQNQPEEQRGER